MKPAILNNQNSSTKTSANSKADHDLSHSPALGKLLARYGKDALKPRYFSFPTPGGDEEIVLVPKLRYDMGEEDWEALGLELRNQLIKIFYEYL